ncbi:sarcosine oxidase subunit delta [Jannaschia donghaensis]|uniref:Sarcosine oxidase, delta subunit family n=1 Tax=Jannaschia donghaensis TaxID=420998 RepID=A0A0M6YLF9_9RHOB|nr:sarcosine oxidase subunit delta [Jannaschia donghaensis]CTQ50495.1 sarcosine oxidase, delta subunit family [Jannaschia donghaensis]
MLIPCPHCGLRDLAEFTYVGDATRNRPILDAPEGDWADYLYLRTNPMGRHAEHWQHTAGCRSVLTVRRDTVTHEIFGATMAGTQA